MITNMTDSKAVRELREAMNGPYLSTKREIIRKCAVVCIEIEASRYSEGAGGTYWSGARKCRDRILSVLAGDDD